MNWAGITEELVRSAAAGDVAAVTELLTYSRQPLRTYIERKVPRRQRGLLDADDVVQTACMDAFRSIQGFEYRGEDSIQRWLCTIALQALRKTIRSQTAVKRGGGRQAVPTAGGLDDSATCLLNMMCVDEHTPSISMAGHERVAAVQAALDHLSPEQGQAVRLVYLEGRRAAEAALVMNKTERAVYNLCDRAKKHLEELLGNRSRYYSRTE